MAMTHVEVQQLAAQILSEVERAVIGKRDVLELILLGLLADGHVLIDDYPGLAKTLTARSFARVTGLGFGRVQFTPDLMPSDITGSSIYDQRTGAFEFRPGPLFTNVLLPVRLRAVVRDPAALHRPAEGRRAVRGGLRSLGFDRRDRLHARDVVDG